MTTPDSIYIEIPRKRAFLNTANKIQYIIQEFFPFAYFQKLKQGQYTIEIDKKEKWKAMFLLKPLGLAGHTPIEFMITLSATFTKPKIEDFQKKNRMAHLV